MSQKKTKLDKFLYLVIIRSEILDKVSGGAKECNNLNKI